MQLSEAPEQYERTMIAILQVYYLGIITDMLFAHDGNK